MLKLFVLGVDNWCRFFSGDPRVKVYVWMEPLTDKEGKTLASFCRPFLKAHLPVWIENNPGLAFLMVPLFIFVFKTRIRVKKYKPGKPGEVVDAELIPPAPGQKEKVA